jgi:hypothetical protein
MRTCILILGLMLTAAAQDGIRPDGLVLVYRHVDLHMNENLGLLKVRFKVQNPTDRPLEGEISFSTPPGAAIYGASIQKHIASTERESKLVAPEQAAALYVADRARQLDDSLQETLVAMRVAYGQKYDPLLLERIGEDRYRLRFVPVPARDNQIVSLRIAFEAVQENAKHVANVPIRWDSNLRATSEVKTTIRISLASGDLLKTIVSTTHTFGSVQRDEDGRRFSAEAKEGADGTDLKLSYALGFWSRPHEIARGGSGRSPISTDEAIALEALRTARAIQAAEESDRPTLALSSSVVSAYGSFLVIPKEDARALAREAGRELKTDSGPTARLSGEELKECEFIRTEMKLPARSWGPRCEIRVISTTDAARIQWARDHGIIPGRSTGLLLGTSFEYVKHGSACRVREPNVRRLREMAESLK